MVQTAGVCVHLGVSSVASEQDEVEEPRNVADIHYMNSGQNNLPDLTMRSGLCAVSKSDRYTFPRRCKSPGTRPGIPGSPTHPVNPRKTKVGKSSEKVNFPSWHYTMPQDRVADASPRHSQKDCRHVLPRKNNDAPRKRDHKG